MKLAIVSNTRGYSWAGSETLWFLAAMQALREGHRVTAIVHLDLMASEQIAQFLQAGGEVENWRPFWIARFQSVKEKIRPSFSTKKLDRFDSILVSAGSLPSLNYVPGLLAGVLKTSAPVILLCQFNADHLYISTSERVAVAEVMKRSAACVFVSRRNLLEARRQFALEPPNARIILNPVRTILKTPCAWLETMGTASFASVARFETAWKGQDLLLDVLNQAQWLERNWQLRFYGNGPDLEHIKKLTGFFKLSDRVFFEGFVKDLSEIWTKNHLLLMPSHGEGTPLAALEAMMYGRPVVATDVGGNAEIIEDGVTGFVADAPTVRSFSNALERAWQHKSHWQQMGLAAHKRVCSLIAEDPSTRLFKTWVAAAATK